MMHPWTGYDFFLSYAREQESFVTRFVEDLEKRRYRIFVDRKIPAGKDYEQHVSEALSRSWSAIVVHSKDSAASAHVKTEVDVMLHESRIGRGFKTRRIVVVLLDDTPVPPQLSKFQRVDCRAKSESQYRYLLQQIPQAIGWWGRWSLRSVATVAFCGVLTIPIGVSLRATMTRINDQAQIKALQAHVQGIDSVIQKLMQPPSARDGDQEYYDPTSRQLLGKDHWENGRLIYRWLYDDNRVVARDEYEYQGERLILTKKRTYVDDERRSFLTDWFTPGGALARKCAQLQPSQPCTELVDDMRSPLPPTWAMFYR